MSIYGDSTGQETAGSVPRSGVVTLLFTDIVASTELMDRLGDDAWEELRRAHFGMLKEAVALSGGTPVKNLGDGLMAVFASGVDALECAVAIQQAVARHSRSASQRRFEIRVGLHAGEPRHEDGDYFGSAVVIARRLCDAAVGGEILASRLVADLVGARGAFGFTDVGPLALKGIGTAVPACRVDWQERARLPFPAAMAGIREAAFVGRESELAQLGDAWRRSQDGNRQVVLLAGEPGIGKTTLAIRAAETSWEQGALVLFGHCDEESLIPFQPFVEAVVHYTENASTDDLRRHLGNQAADMALLLPTLAQRLPELAGVTSTGAETERFRIFEAVAGLMAAIGAEMPVVLVLDDLHWADRPTLGLFRHLIRRSDQLPLLVVGTYRDTDLSRTHPMAEVLVDLRRAQLVNRLPLRGLALDDVLKLLVPDGIPEPPDVALAEALWRETEGSPLFLRESLRHLAETGAIARVADGRWRANRRVEQLGIPEGVKEVIGRRLTRLSQSANAVLLAASVVGREFPIDLVARLTDLSLDDVLDALDEATAAGIVTELGNQPGRYSFTHALVRQALYSELSLTRRVRWHQRVGEAIEDLYRDDLRSHVAELAHHFTHAAAAGLAEKAIGYCRAAGETNMARVAYEEAARYFSMALELIEETETLIESRADLLLAKGEAQWRAGDPGARPTFTTAAALGREAGNPDTLARAALGFAGASVRPVWVEIGVVNDEAVALLEEALAAIGAVDGELRAWLLAVLARELHWSPGTRRRREELSSEAVAMARRLGDDRTLAYVLVHRSLATMGPDTIAQRIVDADEVLALARRLGDAALRYTAQGHRAIACLEVGDTQRAKDLWAEVERDAQRLKDPNLLEAVLVGEATIAEVEGRFDDASECRTAAFQRGQEAHDRNVVIEFLASSALWLRRRGRSGELLGPSGVALTLYPLCATAIQAAMIVGYSKLEDHQAVRQLLDVVDPAAPDFVCADLVWLFTICCVAEGVVFVRDEQRARALHELLLPYRDQIAVIGFAGIVGPVASHLGMLASAMGEHHLAVEHGRAGLTLAERSEFPVLVAESQVTLARILLDGDEHEDRPEAMALARSAADVAEAMGMAGLATDAHTLLSDRPTTVPSPADLEPATRRDRGRSRLTVGARSLVGRLSRERDDAELVRRFGSPLAQRALFTAMAKSFQPSTAYGFEGEILFEVRLPSDGPEPLPPDWWTIDVRGRRALARPERAFHPAVVITTELPDLIRLLSDELHPMRAVIEGRVHIEGDVLVAARVPDMFGGLEGFTERTRSARRPVRAVDTDAPRHPSSTDSPASTDTMAGDPAVGNVVPLHKKTSAGG